MKRLAELLGRREKVASWYGERLAEIPRVRPPTLDIHTTRASWFVYVARFEPEVNRDMLARDLESRGVPVRPYFLPIHLQPYMVERFHYRVGDFPITEELGRQGLALPFSSVMTEDQVEYVCRVIADELGRVHPS